MDLSEVAEFVRGLKRWGSTPHSAHFRGDYCCSNSDCGLMIFNADCQGEEGWFKYVIGFDPDLRSTSIRCIENDVRFSPTGHGNEHDLVVGGVFVECPRCFDKFWFHITVGSFKAGKRVCKKWPKETG